MGFVEAIKTCLAKYFVFSGRAARSEYWWFVLFVVLVVGGVAGIHDSILDPVGPDVDRRKQVFE